MSEATFRTDSSHKPILYTDATALPAGVPVVDTFDTCLRELFYIEHPEIDKRKPHDESLITDYVEQKRSEIGSVYAHYPQHDLMLRIPEEAVYYRLRTARNRNLILPEEQTAFRAGTVAIAGLSVGSAVAALLVQTGGPQHFKLADHDTVELTNLNRMRASLVHMGMNKAEVAAALAWELDPFATIEIWDQGINADTLPTFLGDEEPVDVFVDEMDSIPLKLAARVAARDKRVPVVMATDNGDSAVVDIERFDLEPDRELFHGRVSADDLTHPPQTAAEFNAMVNKIVDPQFFTERQLASVAEIGKTLAGVAQIATAANIAGAAVAYAVREIVCKNDLPSGRYLIGCEAAFAEAVQK